MSEKPLCGNGIGIRVRPDVPLIAPPAGQFADVVQGFDVQRTGTFLQYRIAKGLRGSAARAYGASASGRVMENLAIPIMCPSPNFSARLFWWSQATDAHAAGTDRRAVRAH
jgi:hypothetical protein